MKRFYMLCVQCEDIGIEIGIGIGIEFRVQLRI
jgi:hypothetical protein